MFSGFTALGRYFRRVWGKNKLLEMSEKTMLAFLVRILIFMTSEEKVWKVVELMLTDLHPLSSVNESKKR